MGCLKRCSPSVSESHQRLYPDDRSESCFSQVRTGFCEKPTGSSHHQTTHTAHAAIMPQASVLVSIYSILACSVGTSGNYGGTPQRARSGTDRCAQIVMPLRSLALYLS